MIVAPVVGYACGQVAEVDGAPAHRSLVFLEAHHGVEVVDKLGEAVGIVAGAGEEKPALLLGYVLVHQYRVEIALDNRHRGVELVAHVDADLALVEYLLVLGSDFLPVQQEQPLRYLAELVFGEAPGLDVVGKIV